jgi:hypothetical protein
MNFMETSPPYPLGTLDFSSFEDVSTVATIPGVIYTHPPIFF